MIDEPHCFLVKGEEAWRAAKTLHIARQFDQATGRSYYAMFHAAQALLSSSGRRFRKHSGVHAAFGQHFAKTGALDPKYHRWLLNSFNRRVVNDYTFNPPTTEEESAESLAQARELLDVARRYMEMTGG